MNSTPSTLNPPDIDDAAENTPEGTALEPLLDVTELANPNRHPGCDLAAPSPPASAISIGQTVVQTVPRRARWRIVRRAIDLIRSHSGYMNSPSQHALEGTHHRY